MVSSTRWPSARCACPPLYGGASGGLLRLHDEAVALVEVDPSRRRAAVIVLKFDAPFEGVVVVFVLGLRGFGFRQAEQAAKLAGECLEIGQFRAAGLLPALDKGIDFGGVDTVILPFGLPIRIAHGATIAARTVGESPITPAGAPPSSAPGGGAFPAEVGDAAAGAAFALQAVALQETLHRGGPEHGALGSQPVAQRADA